MKFQRSVIILIISMYAHKAFAAGCDLTLALINDLRREESGVAPVVNNVQNEIPRERENGQQHLQQSEQPAMEVLIRHAPAVLPGEILPNVQPSVQQIELPLIPEPAVPSAIRAPQQADPFITFLQFLTYEPQCTSAIIYWYALVPATRVEAANKHLQRCLGKTIEQLQEDYTAQLNAYEEMQREQQRIQEEERQRILEIARMERERQKTIDIMLGRDSQTQEELRRIIRQQTSAQTAPAVIGSKG